MPDRDFLRDRVAVGGTPGATVGSPAPIAPQHVTLRANPWDEYVSAGYQQWFANIPRALSWDIDDLSETVGTDVYAAMLNEASVLAAIYIFKSGVISSGMTFSAAIDDEEDPQHARASTILAFCEQVISDLPLGLDNILWNMLDALAFGNKVAEQVYTMDATYTGRQQVILRALKVKPTKSVAFVVDSFNNVLGLLGLIPGVAFPVQVGTYLVSPQNVPNLLPRDKFAILTFRPKDADPRGTSILRAAYDPYNAKTRLKQQYLKYLSQFASPSLVGTLSPDTLPQPAVDATGTPIRNADGSIQMLLPRDAMMSSLTQFQNGTAIVIPGGSTVEPIQMAGNGEAFQDAFRWYDQQIVKAILHQTLGDRGGRASGPRGRLHPPGRALHADHPGQGRRGADGAPRHPDAALPLQLRRRRGPPGPEAEPGRRRAAGRGRHVERRGLAHERRLLHREPDAESGHDAKPAGARAGRRAVHPRERDHHGAGIGRSERSDHGRAYTGGERCTSNKGHARWQQKRRPQQRCIAR